MSCFAHLASPAFRRPLALFAAAAAGCLLPGLHAVAGVIPYCVAFMLLSVFLRMEPSFRVLHRSHAYAGAFNLLFAGALWWGFRRLGSAQWAATAFFVAITPTATAAPVIVSMIGGDIAYATTMFIVSNLLVSAALPFLVPHVVAGITTGEVSVSARLVWDVARRVLVITIVPFLVASVCRRIDTVRAERAGERTSGLVFYVWAFVVALVVAQARDYLGGRLAGELPTVLLTALLSLAICAVNFAVGHWLGSPDFALECSQTLGQKNTSFTVYFAGIYANPMVALGPAFYILWHNLWNAVQLYRYGAEAAASASEDRNGSVSACDPRL
jgi:BASS family bile acid:Na+ symporter